ncbi:hypothetical protein D068_cds26850 [Bacillus atrophaeus UCMB-5137]|nr:hypothetical protein D068_cds26850 [Bacillus atrophaeus UCMB-5137]
MPNRRHSLLIVVHAITCLDKMILLFYHMRDGKILTVALYITS